MARPRQHDSSSRNGGDGAAPHRPRGTAPLLLRRRRRRRLPAALLATAAASSLGMLLVSHRALLRAENAGGNGGDNVPEHLRRSLFAVSNRAATTANSKRKKRRNEPLNAGMFLTRTERSEAAAAAAPLRTDGSLPRHDADTGNNIAGAGNTAASIDNNDEKVTNAHEHANDDLYRADAPSLESDDEPTPPLSDADLIGVVARQKRRSLDVNGRLDERRRQQEEWERREADADGDLAPLGDSTSPLTGENTDELYSCPPNEGLNSTAHFNRYTWYSSASTWEDAGRWLIPPSQFNAMVLQLVQALPPEAQFKRGQRVYESACGSGLFLTALEDAAEMMAGVGSGELKLEMHGSDIVENSVDMVRRAVYPPPSYSTGEDLSVAADVNGRGSGGGKNARPSHKFCAADSHDLTHLPPNTYDWSVTGFLEPMRTTSPLLAERWTRWWVYHMSRIAKPDGWIVVAFNYVPGKNHDKQGAIREVGWWRRVRQTRLWRVRPDSVRIVRQNAEWPKRKHARHRYHVIMQRDGAEFGEEGDGDHQGCSHVKFRAGLDPDYAECRFTGENLTEYEPLEEFVAAGGVDLGMTSSSARDDRGAQHHHQERPARQTPSYLQKRQQRHHDNDNGDHNQHAYSNAATSPKPPFQLYRDFYIGSLVAGSESWDDLLRLRWQLSSPTVSFYADKAAQKRWLKEERGVDVPRAYALKYASELLLGVGGNNNSGGEGDEKKGAAEEDEMADAIEGLLPGRDITMDYVVKPTHSSGAGGVRLVSYVVPPAANGDANNAKVKADDDGAAPVTSMRVGFQREALLPARDLAPRDVARRLAEYLTSEPFEGDSIALRNVRPGFVVEERFVLPGGMTGGADVARNEEEHASSQYQHPLEFEVTCLWGTAWMTTLRRGETILGLVKRDGTMAQCEPLEVPALPKWVEWARVVEIAEALAGGKDVIRVDVLVGAPAGTQGQSKDRPLRYAVTEVEVQPIVEDVVPPEVLEEGARLWVAGYTRGRYEVVENKEVPAAFRAKSTS